MAYSVTGYKSGYWHYKVYIILKGGKKFEWETYIGDRSDLLADVSYWIKLIREWGWSEEVDRVYATRYDCIIGLERVQRVA